MSKRVYTGLILSLFFSSLVFISTFSSDCLAQDKDPERGRLPDGRAFRTDADGAQLIDYIAELEQTLTEQGRRVIGLEDENVSLKAEIDRVKAGHPEKVAEKVLIGPSGAGSQDSDQIKIKCPVQEVREEEHCLSAKECDEKQTELHTEIADLQDELEKTRRDKNRFQTIAQRPVEKTVCPEMPELEVIRSEAKSEKEAEMRADISRIEKELENTRIERDRFLKIAQRPVEKTICPEMPDLEAIRNDAKNEQQLAMRADISRLEQELIKTRAERDRFSSLVQIAATRPKFEESNLQNKLEMRASMNPDLEASRQNVVELIRARMKKELQLLLSRKDERDLLFAKYTKLHQGVGIIPSSLRAKSGRELGLIGDLLSRAETVRELSAIRTDLEEIRTQMADDLALVERMSKLPS